MLLYSLAYSALETIYYNENSGIRQPLPFFPFLRRSFPREMISVGRKDAFFFLFFFLLSLLTLFPLCGKIMQKYFGIF